MQNKAKKVVKNLSKGRQTNYINLKPCYGNFILQFNCKTINCEKIIEVSYLATSLALSMRIL